MKIANKNLLYKINKLQITFLENCKKITSNKLFPEEKSGRKKTFSKHSQKNISIILMLVENQNLTSAI